MLAYKEPTKITHIFNEDDEEEDDNCNTEVHVAVL